MCVHILIVREDQKRGKQTFGLEGLKVGRLAGLKVETLEPSNLSTFKPSNLQTFQPSNQTWQNVAIRVILTRTASPGQRSPVHFT
jgi:hypothetical protein